MGGGYAASGTGSGAWTGHLVRLAGVYPSQTSASAPDYVHLGSVSGMTGTRPSGS